MGLSLVTAPASEPVTLAEAKAHARIDFTDDDTLIVALITVARAQAESMTRRSFITQTYDLFLDRFPIRVGGHVYWKQPDQIDIPRSPLQSVTSITYIDSDGNSQTLASTEYKIDTASEPARIVPAYDKSWPSTRAEIDAVTIRFVAGYGAASAVPQAIKQAILMMIAHWYNNRESVDVSGMSAGEVPQSAEWLLSPYRVVTF